jgi:uncharacterized protein (TIGR02145 family)
MKIKIAIFIITVSTNLIYGQTGSITNINPAQRTDGSMMVDIYYDLAGSQAKYRITVEASFDGGASFATISQVSGHVGYHVPIGNQRHITWSFGSEFPGSYSAATQIRLTASYNCGDVLVDDRDGQSYNTVQIGTQCWMAENLKIGIAIYPSTYQQDNGIIEKYRAYTDWAYEDSIYGGLYQWNEMMQYGTTTGAQGICPNGWHVPSNDEFTVLINFLGGLSVAGGKMKETGFAHWNNPNTGATNESGFMALGAGSCWPNQIPPESYWAPYFCRQRGFFWTRSSPTWLMAVACELAYDNQNAHLIQRSWTIGHSVRCINN